MARKRDFDKQATVNRLARALGNSLAESVPAWIFAESDGNIDAVEETDAPNTVYIRFDLSSNERTYAYYDVTMNSQLFLDGLAIKVRPYYRTRPGDKREWVMVGSDEIMAGIQFGATPPDPAAGFGGLVAHTHQTVLQGGLLNAGLIFDAGAVPVTYGGTGLSALATGSLLRGNGSTPLTALPIGATNEILTVIGGVPVWLANNAAFTVAGDTGTPQTISNGDTLTIAGGVGLSSVASATDTVTINLDVPVVVASGGTGLTSLTAESLVKGNGTSALVAIPVGSDGQVLGVTAGVVGYITPSSGSMSSFDVAGDSGTPQTITNGNTLNILTGVGLSSVASATDTVTINLDVPVVVASGGTGLTSLTAEALLKGNGTGAMIEVPVGSNGQVLTVVGGSPAFAAAPAGSITTIDTITTVTPTTTLKFPPGTVRDNGSGQAEYNPYGLATTSDYNPVSVGNCVVWYKANAGVTKNTVQKVTSWSDQSGNGYTATGVAATAPAYTPTVTLNGFPQLFFDGKDNRMTTTVTPQTGAGTRTCIIVGSWGDSSPYQNNTRNVFEWGSAAGLQGYAIAIRTIGTSPAWGFYYYGSEISSSAPPAASSPFIVCGAYDGTVNRLYHNGVLCLEHTVALNTGTATKLTLGRGIFGSGTEAGFLTAEIIIFNDLLTQAEREAMFTALGTKYNIPIVF